MVVVMWSVTHKQNDISKFLNLFKLLGLWWEIVPTSQGSPGNTYLCLSTGPDAEKVLSQY